MKNCEHLFQGKCSISSKAPGVKVPSMCGEPDSKLQNWWSSAIIVWVSRDCVAKNSLEEQQQCDGFQPSVKNPLNLTLVEDPNGNLTPWIT